MKENLYFKNAIDEMLKMIKDNIILYYNNFDYFTNLKKFCKNKENIKYQKLDYYQLVFLVEEVFTELINCEYLYDLRALN